MMVPLIINAKVREEINCVKKYAEENIVSFETMLKIKNGKLEAIGDDPRFSVFVPMAFKVVYSLEEQSNNVICRHLSMSIDAPERVPNVYAVVMMVEEFGFVNKKIDISTPYNIDSPGYLLWWMENTGYGSLDAINVIEPLNGDYELVRKK